MCLLKVPSLAQSAPTTCRDDGKGGNTCWEPFTAISLPTEDYTHGESCWISGWPQPAVGNANASLVLQSVGINLFSNDYCNENYDEFSVGDLELCGEKPDRNHIGYCKGDSGGPVTCVRNGQPVLVGIVSRSDVCAVTGYPGVYANTYAHLDWIHTTINNTTNIPTTIPTTIPINGTPNPDNDNSKGHAQFVVSELLTFITLQLFFAI